MRRILIIATAAVAIAIGALASAGASAAGYHGSSGQVAHTYHDC